MTYRIEWRPRARKAFLALDKPVHRRIGGAVDALAADPRPAAAKMITPAHGVLRIRVGDYRVLYTIDEGLWGSRTRPPVLTSVSMRPARIR